MMDYDVVVVGGGVAGLTAAAYSARAGKSVLLCEKEAGVGGYVGSFELDGFVFDRGIRSIESSGIVFPMLRQLGLDIEMIHSAVSIGIADRMVSVDRKESLVEYGELLKDLYPASESEIEIILKQITTIMGHMDVLYGIDNPLFLDSFNNVRYLVGTLLPWAFRYLLSMPKVAKLNGPVDDHLKTITGNQSLVDIIAQHFFRKTPTSFALSYFSLYLDYHYPKGGTRAFPSALESYIISHGGTICVDTEIRSIDVDGHTVTDASGKQIGYGNLVWAADLKTLYNQVRPESLGSTPLRTRLTERKEELAPKEGGDSILTLFLAVDLPPSYFSKRSNPHLFFTPRKEGLSMVDDDEVMAIVEGSRIVSREEEQEIFRTWLDSYLAYNTFEISIPVLRDASLAPKGKTALIVSILFDYRIAKRIADAGWYDQFKTYAEERMVTILADSLYPDIPNAIIHRFSSTPITMERYTGNSGGAITGWAFTNRPIPVVHEMRRVAKSVDTILPDIYQVGQWTFSPSGLPISVLTGKLAADAIIRRRK